MIINYLSLYLLHADGRHRNRTVANNYTYIYHDYYVRAEEGDTIDLCARLSEAKTDPFYLYYYSYYYTTEVHEGLFTQITAHIIIELNKLLYGVTGHTVLYSLCVNLL